MNDAILDEVRAEIKLEQEQKVKRREKLHLFLKSTLFPPAEMESVTLYPEGFTLKARKTIGNPSGCGGGKRGEIETFSMASRRNFRQYMMKHIPSPGRTLYSATFTVPGDSLTTLQYRSLWESWRLRNDVLEWGVIWRAEVQPERKALHWHVLISCGVSGHKNVKSPDDEASYWESKIRESWCETIDKAFPCVDYPRPVWNPLLPFGVKLLSGRLSWWPGATYCRDPNCRCQKSGHMVSVECQLHGRGAWFRYLADHSSKVKRDQIGENIGRHWGVLGRKYFDEIGGKQLTLNDTQYHVFRRCYERLCTHRKLDVLKPFGKVLCRRPKRGRFGTSQCFVRPETVERMVKYALSVVRK